MVVLGTYPYQHTLTLEQLHRSTGKLFLYHVDENKIVEQHQLPQNITVDNEHYIAYGEEIGRTVDSYKSQIIPPPTPEEVIRDIPENYRKIIDDVSGSALCLIVNDQSSGIMEDIGAKWNDHFGTWIADAEHIKLIRDKRRRRYDGKVHRQAHVDNTFKVYGDLSAHISKLKSIGAMYNEDDDSWIVKSSVIHNIAHLFTKK